MKQNNQKGKTHRSGIGQPRPGAAVHQHAFVACPRLVDGGVRLFEVFGYILRVRGFDKTTLLTRSRSFRVSVAAWLSNFEAQ